MVWWSIKINSWRKETDFNKFKLFVPVVSIKVTGRQVHSMKLHSELLLRFKNKLAVIHRHFFVNTKTNTANTITTWAPLLSAKAKYLYSSTKNVYLNFYYCYLYQFYHSSFIPNKMLSMLLVHRWEVTLFYDYFYRQTERYTSYFIFHISFISFISSWMLVDISTQETSIIARFIFSKTFFLTDIINPKYFYFPLLYRYIYIVTHMWNCAYF